MEYAEKGSAMKSYLSGSRGLNNVFWSVAVSLGGLGFFLTGLSSFFHTNLLFFSDSSGISFLPQGIVLLFYGTVGSLLGTFLCLTVWWDVGSGYNEYNRDSQQIRIYRKGFPGKNRELVFDFGFDEIKSVKMRIKEGLNPKRQLLLCLTDNREIPLTGVERPIALNKIEDDAITIAKYLNVFLETE
jgi:hypothetical protein|tara:strand:- start:45566 stop:46123 length:558 start_codon:yes stop_codon:yes gene_type:complete